MQPLRSAVHHNLVYSFFTAPSTVSTVAQGMHTARMNAPKVSATITSIVNSIVTALAKLMVEECRQLWDDGGKRIGRLFRAS